MRHRKHGHKHIPPGRNKNNNSRCPAKSGQTAGFSVHLSVQARLGGDVDVQAVHLDAFVRRPVSVARDAFPGVQERQQTARQLTRGHQPEALAGLLAALAHPQRIRILTKLLAAEATHQVLAKTTGLKAGPLYHHIRELRSASLIGPKVRDLYVLTVKGRRAILAGLAVERLAR